MLRVGDLPARLEIWGALDVSALPEPVDLFGWATVAPNPFRSESRCEFVLDRAGDTRVEIHNANGRLVREGDLGYVPAGQQQTYLWDGRSSEGHQVPSGVYYVSIVTDGHRLDRRVTIVR